MQAFLDTMKRRGVSFLEMLAMEMKVLQLVLSHAHCQLFQTLMVAMYLRFRDEISAKVTKLTKQVLSNLHVTASQCMRDSLQAS